MAEQGPMQPPLMGVAPPLQCNRVTGAHDGEYCGREGKWHIIWTADCENGIACDEHADEAKRLWVYFGLHPYEMACSMPGSRYFADIDKCLPLGEEPALEVQVAQEVSV